MSLSKQLISLIALLLLLVFFGTLAISIQNTRDYMTKQLESHAQDTATSLGLSITPAITAGDTPMINSMVDAIFDRGYYSSIYIKDISGKDIVTRELPVQFEGVPEWFISLFPLETPEATSTITSGWRQASTVHIRSHPGYAYQKLWQISIQNFGWVLTLALLSILAGIIFIRLILTPLRAVESQAKAIAAKEFPIQRKLPKTPELRQVTKAMNHMSAKVAQMLGAQTELTEKMRARAYEDPVTKLQNRRSLKERLNHITRTPEEYQTCAVFLVRLDNLKELNERKSYLQGDELLNEIGSILQTVCNEITDNTVARIGGADFAILAPHISLEETRALADKICNNLGRLHTRGKIDDSAKTHTGIAWFNGKQSASELVSAADAALCAAQTKGNNTWYIHDEKSLKQGEIRSSSEWKKFLQRKLEQGEIEIHRQLVQSCKDEKTLHYEVLARIQEEDGSLIPAGIFMPIAERYNLTSAIDKIVIDKLIVAISKDSQSLYAINLSPVSLQDASFTQWLLMRLGQNSEVAGKLIFETTEMGAIIDLESMKTLIANIQHAGSQFSLDHFGTASPSFGYLRKLKLNYIKIDGSYIRRIELNEDNQFFIRSLAEIAHGLDIQVIAEYVETNAEQATLQDLHIDGIQGYLPGAPEVI
ncbi:MAG: EAL domain-containing protein [Gammaproteobacteria bacterium]|nr:EAL domain-containing protein [Gammaproteobacteria bacterium]